MRRWCLVMLLCPLGGCYRAAKYGVDDPARGALVVLNRSPFELTGVYIYALPDSTLLTSSRGDDRRQVFPVAPGEYVVSVGYRRPVGVLYDARGATDDRVVARAGEAVILTLSGGDPTPLQPSLEFKPPTLERAQSVRPAFWVLVGAMALLVVIGLIAKVQEAKARRRPPASG
jgi:hypothetical protein